MEKNSYKLIGYLNRRVEKKFTFVIPIYSLRGTHFRCEINEVNSIIESFIPITVDFNDKLPKALQNTTKKIGDEGLFMYVKKGKVYYGNMLNISIKLLNIIRHKEVSNLDEYDIYFFLNIPEKIDESLQKVIEEYKELNLNKDNFLKPQETVLDFNQFSNNVLVYSRILEMSTKAIDYKSFYNKSENDDKLFRFGKYSTSKAEIINRFNELIDKDKSDIYKDLIVHGCIYNKIHARINSPQFRLRKLIDLKPVSETSISENEILLGNSQSIIKSSGNALEISMNMEKEFPIIDYRKEDKEVTEEEAKDFSNTFSIGKRVKNQLV